MLFTAEPSLKPLILTTLSEPGLWFGLIESQRGRVLLTEELKTTKVCRARKNNHPGYNYTISYNSQDAANQEALNTLGLVQCSFKKNMHMGMTGGKTTEDSFILTYLRNTHF